MRFAVITKTERSGNMASALGSVFFKTKEGDETNDWRDEYDYVPFDQALHLHTQVFWPGEILVLDGNGREIGGMGRKPSKWFVEVEEFDNVEDAIARAREIERHEGEGTNDVA